MIKVTVSISIRRRSSDVFTFISDVSNNPRWQKSIEEVYYTTEPPIQTGSEFIQVARFLGRRIESTFKIVDYEPGRLIKATTVMSTLPITCTRIVEPIENGCQVTALVEMDGGLFKLAEPLLRNKMQSSAEKDYAKLKELIEK